VTHGACGDRPIAVEDDRFEAYITGELAALPGVVAVTLGGSRARGEHRPDSDWDFAVYYRGHFDPDTLRAKGFAGTVFDVGAWGGGVMNGGAWLTIEDRRVDVHYRDLDDVELRLAEALAGRFHKEYLLFHVAGIPSYVVVAELALNRVLRGSLPVPEYPAALAEHATRRWHDDAVLSLDYGRTVLRSQKDTTVAMANALCALTEEAHSRMAAAAQWVLNEKGLVRRASLEEEAKVLLRATTVEALDDAMEIVARRLGGSPRSG
jgi:hypothetical protein